jgi:hypothetical protein
MPTRKRSERNTKNNPWTMTNPNYKFGVSILNDDDFCWRKIRTLRQAHSKPNKVGLTHEQIPKRASQFSWN